MTTSADKSPKHSATSKSLLLVVLFCAAAVAAWLIFFGLQLARHDIVSITGPTMGTQYSIRFVQEAGKPDSAEIQVAVQDLLAEINRQMSTYDPASELSRFNAHQGDDWFEVSPATVDVVGYALQVAEKSGGRFDPTIGPLVNLWGFGPEKKRDDPPTDDEIDAARQRVGYKKIEVRTEPPALRKFATDVYLDLSAVAKGYAVDQVSEALAQAGAHASMVEIGGEVVTRGTKPDGTPWRIGVERPDDTGRMVQLVLELGDRALATSGDYRNYFESQGRRYSHTIDPKTGRPVLHDLAQVSVEAGACMEADAVATALLVLGEQAGYDYCVAHDVAALLMIRRGEQIIERATPRFLQLHPDYEETR